MWEMTYSIDFDMATEKGESCGRVYKSNRSAIAAAKRLFASRASNPNDELWLYRGGRIDHDACLGKVAFNHNGETAEWFPAP